MNINVLPEDKARARMELGNFEVNADLADTFFEEGDYGTAAIYYQTAANALEAVDRMVQDKKKAEEMKSHTTIVDVKQYQITPLEFMDLMIYGVRRNG